MKYVISIVIIFSLAFRVQAQDFSFNQGGTAQTDYFIEIPFEWIRDKVIITVNLNGQERRFLLDTGAPVVITQLLYEELQPPTLLEIPITDVNQVKRKQIIASLSGIEIGELTFDEVPTVVTEDNDFMNCFQIDGFIGSNLLRNSIVQFDLKQKKVIFTDNPTRLNLLEEQSTALELDQQSGPILPIELNGKGNEELLFDSGSDAFYDMTKDHYKIFKKRDIFEVISTGFGSNSMGLYGTEKGNKKYRLRIPTLDLAGTTFTNVVTDTNIDDNSRIGAKLLRYGVVTVDYANKKFYFEPYEDQKQIDAYQPKWNVSPIVDEGTLTVGLVWESVRKQLKPGDQILEINGKSFATISICDLILNSPLEDQETAILTIKDKRGRRKQVAIRKE